MATKEQILDEYNKMENLNKARFNALSLSIRMIEHDLGALNKGVILGEIKEGNYNYPKHIEDIINIIHTIKDTYNLQNPFVKKEGE